MKVARQAHKIKHTLYSCTQKKNIASKLNAIRILWPCTKQYANDEMRWLDHFDATMDGDTHNSGAVTFVWLKNYKKTKSLFINIHMQYLGTENGNRIEQHTFNPLRYV